jgi:hypothetical protein
MPNRRLQQDPSPENMRQHLDSSLHKNVRPFKCGECTLDFTQQVHLDKHVACVPRKQRSFQCTREGCTETFARWSIWQHT